ERLSTLSADLERALADEPLDASPAAFFCAEYAVHGSLPVYSGGLGALAGDILKAASDCALPLVGVGLMYHQGYFRQRIDASGWQHEYWVETDPDRVPAALVTGDDGLPVTVTVPIADRDVVAQIWRVDVGRVPLLLLDCNRDENHLTDRWITSRLYVGDPGMRLGQYAVLGIGGMRALEALGVDPGVVHLNEGHAAMACLEQVRAENAGDIDDAFEAVRRKTVFTTHTPVPAGNDTYPAAQMAETLAGIASAMGCDPSALVRRGRTHTDEDAEPFGVTQFALRSSRIANGVSARHGEVAREMWQAMWPDREIEDVPIAHVTNGAHIPTWIGGPMRELLDRYLGEGWTDRAVDPATWEGLDDIPDEELWAARGAQRANLVDVVRERSVMDRLGRGDTAEYVRSAVNALDPDMLTIGFARRVATYKRLDLLLRDVDRALSLLGDEARPVQLILAGKAHPKDDDGKRLVQRLFEMKSHLEVGRRVVYLDDYDLALGAAMVRGCDVWVNVPRPPLEASGTSGIKSAQNGGLQLSVLDGWWPEAYDGSNGWAISGEVDNDHGAQDWRHAAELYRLLSEEVVPTFYDRDGAAYSQRWLTMVRNSLRTIGPQFSATRMVRDYAERIYPAHVVAPTP
ncbi:MAG TPA: alpha-glucan family phosphorylase, partial [Solirubrobacteraceae bacterium]|nr:alpha-glucan family phosphorylase [Solirubrobacteraceae bacterium]